VCVVITVNSPTTNALTPVTMKLIVVRLLTTALDDATQRLFVTAALIETICFAVIKERIFVPIVSFFF
jgi:hypothetical protein